MDQQLTLTLTSHLPPSLNRLRLGVVHLGGTLATLAERAPAIVALNDVNVFPLAITNLFSDEIDKGEFTNNNFKIQFVNQNRPEITP